MHKTRPDSFHLGFQILTEPAISFAVWKKRRLVPIFWMSNILSYSLHVMRNKWADSYYFLLEAFEFLDCKLTSWYLEENHESLKSLCKSGLSRLLSGCSFLQGELSTPDDYSLAFLCPTMTNWLRLWLQRTESLCWNKLVQNVYPLAPPTTCVDCCTN
jgi:hypothetical protein